MNKWKCPHCESELILVEQSPKSLLNEYQWEAIKAGDYYCPTCKPVEEGMKYRYFWKRELMEKDQLITYRLS